MQETGDSARMNRAEFWESFNVVYIYQLIQAQYIKSFLPSTSAFLAALYRIPTYLI